MPITRKHKSILFSGIALMAGATLFTGCASDPLPVTKSEQYARDFIKTFGVYDQSHDWNHATQTSVTVTTATPTDVKVMADFEGKRYIFASFTNVEGRHTLNVDIPKGVTDLIVSANGRNYDVKAGGEVEINATTRTRTASRSMSYGSYPVTIDGVEKSIEISKTSEEDWRTYSSIDVMGFMSVMPEGELNINKPGVTKDFVFRSLGPIIIYPVYWNTVQPNKLGIAYKDENGELQHIELWQKYSSDTYDPENNLLGVTTFIADENNNAPVKELKIDVFYQDSSVKTVLGEDRCYDQMDIETVTPKEYMAILQEKGIDVKTVVEVNGGKCNGTGKYNPWGNFVSIKYIENGTPYDTNIKGVGTNNGANIGVANESCVLSQGIVVDIPVGMRYGMYIERGDGTKLYSVANHNPDPLMQRDESGTILTDENGNKLTVEGEKAFHASTWVDSKFGWTWLGFEDWLTTEGESDMDLNDMVFLIETPHHDDTPPVEVEDPDDPDEPTPEVWEWIIACEDMGTNDFDFNDVVFSVSYPQTDVEEGSKTVTIKALAAGGTLPVYLYYGEVAEGNEIKPDGATSGEFHSWFGDYKSNQVINAASISATGKTATITVDYDFTMACTMKAEDGNMGGFKVKVCHNDSSPVISATNPNFESEIGTAPQMICVPATWCWPRENVFVVDVYPDFNNWCQDQTCTNWHENRAGSGYWPR